MLLFVFHQAVEVLKKSGSVVRLCLERYLRGPKFEQLQQAIAANESTSTASTTATTIGASPAMQHRPPSSQSQHRDGAVKTPSLMRRPSFNADASSAGITASGHVARKLLTNARDSLETRTSNAATDEFGHPVDSSMVEELMVQTTTHGAAGHTPVALVAPISPPLPTSNVPSHHHHQHHHLQSHHQQQQPAAAAAAAAQSAGRQQHKYWVEPVLTADIEDAIRQHWRAVMPPDTRIIVAQIRKFAASSGLGISLEGTVDVEGGMEVRPHHYIRSILPEGPVGQNGQLRSSDELLGEFYDCLNDIRQSL